VRDLAGAAQDVVAQYDMASINALRALIDRLKDVSAAPVSSCAGGTVCDCLRCAHAVALPYLLVCAVQDPEKVVAKIVKNVTVARPLFNNPVGNGVYTLWCVP
jgi:hypothetical protein